VATIICFNNTASNVLIRDLGIIIPGSGSETLSGFLEPEEIAGSSDLIAYCTDNAVSPGVSTLKLNDGVNDIPPGLISGLQVADRFVSIWKWGES